jgi:GNAT superfamily N-acetyltransferase
VGSALTLFLPVGLSFGRPSGIVAPRPEMCKRCLQAGYLAAGVKSSRHVTDLRRSLILAPDTRRLPGGLTGAAPPALDRADTAREQWFDVSWVMAGTAMDRDFQIRRAALTDAQKITALVNLAFRVESFFVDGDRTNIERIRTLMEKGAFLLAEDTAGLAGCVYVELRGERGYFGLLAVEPSRQRRGLGRRLAQEAEEYARAAGCLVMDIMTVNVRTELPPIYHKMGYVETGTASFPSEVRSKLPCHFVVMSKPLV